MKKRGLRWVALITVLLLTAAMAGGCGSGDVNSKSQDKPVIEVDPNTSLKLDKTSYNPEEDIVISFTVPESYSKTAWIAIVPSSYAHSMDVNNAKYQNWNSLYSKTEGKTTIKAPKYPGSYDIRMITDRDEKAGKEVNYQSFEVSAPAGMNMSKDLEKDPATSISIDKTSYKPGEDIVVTFTAPATYSGYAWVGIVPSYLWHGSEKYNDENDYGYQHMDSKSEGKAVLKAPEVPGSYDIRMNSDDDETKGKEVNYVSFTVEAK